MDKTILDCGERAGSLLSKYRSEYLILLATLVMAGGYIFSWLMYGDMRTFMEAQTQAQIETAKTLSELNVRMSEVEMELKVERTSKEKLDTE